MEGEIRLTVLADEPGVGSDVSGSRRVAGSDLVAAIRAAREQGVSLARLLRELIDETSTDVNVDVEAGVVWNEGGRWPLTLPVSPPEVWAAGVTYRRSREAREAESEERSVYARVYEADRPELFLKDAGSRRTVRSGQDIGVRGDSAWTVPEPEIGLVLDARAEIVGYTIGNDVSARDIEGENPLYLPQAKTYRSSCALGPTIVAADGRAGPFRIELRVLAEDGSLLLKEETTTELMQRDFGTLASYLRRCNVIDDGTVLLTGTGIVPPGDFTLQPGWLVEIEVPGIGTLRNSVRLEASS